MNTLLDDLTDDEIVLAGMGEVDMDDMEDFEDEDDFDLEGYGDLGRGRGRRMRRLRRAVRSDIGASRFRKHFLERLHKLPQSIQQALIKGKAQISDAPYYATAELRGTRSELIRLSTPEKLGETNIDNGKLNKDRHLTLSAIRLLFDKEKIDGCFVDPYPAGLLNGEWEMELNGQKVFEKQPIRKFFDGFYGYNTNRPFGLYILNNPKMIAPQTPIEFNVNLPQEVQGFLKVFLEGTTVYGY